MKFTELGLDENILKAVLDNGYEEPTPIQAETIPGVLEGKDIIGQAQTGTGKTAAFGLPILQNVDLDNPNIQAIIISPTRELAAQTQAEIFKLGKYKKAKVQVVYGGSDIRRQINALKSHPQIVVGTPGRLLDHIGRKTIRLDHVKTLVLDEADDMLDMGFLPDIEQIIEQTPSDRQTLLFSATMPAPIKKIGVKFMTDPKQITVKSKELTADLVDQYYVRSKEFEKFDILTRVIDVQSPKLAVVFGRTKRRVDEVAKGLVARGYNAAGIHGDLTQQRRMSILHQFRDGQLDILVATDVAARGLDISGVTHVYNYDIPQDPESYVHRIGRTGRAGAHGTSVTFVTNWEMDYLRDVERLTKKRLLPLKPPTEEEAFAGRAAMAEQNIQELVQKTDVTKFEEQAEHLLEQYDAKTLVAALLNDETKADASEIKVKITPERPLPRKKNGSNRSNNKGGYRGGNRRGNGGGHRGNGNGRSGNGKWNNDRKGGKSRFGRDDRNHGGNKRNDRNSGNKGGANRQFVIKEK
ncbi:DEAD/DEAH box helicase [Pediococcus stilesii]|uniref:DEAD-box ATP-dependent RNA helicase CshA n=1 Tax=Pediococcus stilesii TaxID=331679 RepID=A0A0R2KW99_9LACO|nr:DEAD/DEAH box helicase [Pediococcus stilesii]KRN93753.1 superfamily II DNA RNA helicase [Pediococcus stilesii]TLQ04754.1 DEAD/DEAH box helicase [Pediococcus stilesii]